MRIIAITNQKGGVGKTTTAMNLSAGLGLFDRKVLLIDLDSQANSTSGMGVELGEIKHDIFQVLVDDVPIQKAILPTKTANVDIVPATINLIGADVFITKKNLGEKNLLKKHFDSLEGYDYVILDCPPSLGLVNRNALAASTEVLIPLQAEFFSLEGLSKLLKTIQAIKKGYNGSLKLGGILFTMFDGRTRHSREVEKDVKKFLGEKLFDTKIPKNIALAEAPSNQQAIFDYKIRSKGAVAYAKLTREVLSQEGK